MSPSARCSTHPQREASCACGRCRAFLCLACMADGPRLLCVPCASKAPSREDGRARSALLVSLLLFGLAAGLIAAGVALGARGPSPTPGQSAAGLVSLWPLQRYVLLGGVAAAVGALAALLRALKVLANGGA